MNELQTVLIILAIIVVVGLYFFQKNKQEFNKKNSQDNVKSKSSTDADKALNNLGEHHTPVSERQLGFNFDDSSEEDIDKQPEIKLTEEFDTQKNNAKNIVLEAIDADKVVEFNSNSSTEKQQPAFGIPEDNKIVTKESPQTVESTKPQIFALIVQGSVEFLMTELNQALHGVGFRLTEKNIFVKKDSNGNEIIRVANLLEPGTFTKEQLNNKTLTSPGVVLILELPTTIKAPAAMHDLILMARKISQKLNGRLYNMDKKLTTESHLQKMRDNAIAYESTAI